MIELLVVMVCALASWLSLLTLMPRMLRSVWRHYLWRLRDDIADALLSNSIQKSDAAMDLLVRLEATIKYADRLAVLTLLFVPRPPTDWTDELDATRKKHLAALSESEREKINSFEKRFYDLLVPFLITTSPLGWLLVLVSLPFGLIQLVKQAAKGVREWVSNRSMSPIAAIATANAVYKWMNNRFVTDANTRRFDAAIARLESQNETPKLEWCVG